MPLSLMLSLILLLLILALGESFSEYMQGHWYEKQFAQGFVPVHFIFLLLQLSHALLTFVLLLLGGGNWLISLAIFCRVVSGEKVDNNIILRRGVLITSLNFVNLFFLLVSLGILQS